MNIRINYLLILFCASFLFLENKIDTEKLDKRLNDNLNLLLEQYDVGPKLKKKLKINEKKYKDVGSVTIKFYINKKGKTSKVELLEGSGNKVFDKICTKAIKKSKWKPAIKDDKEIAVWHQLKITY